MTEPRRPARPPRTSPGRSRRRAAPPQVPPSNVLSFQACRLLFDLRELAKIRERMCPVQRQGRYCLWCDGRTR
jgi:hypothetical protein